MLEGVRYPGGKNQAGVPQRIISQFPPHRVYVEPFLGSGAIARYKFPALKTVVCDLSSPAIEAFLKELGFTIATTGGNGEGGSQRRKRQGRIPPAETARVDVGDRVSLFPTMAADLVASLNLMHESSGLFSADDSPYALYALSCDGLAYLRSRVFKTDELVYCDPPYMLHTRRGGRIYDHEFTDWQHSELLSVLCSLPCSVCLSGYRSGLYDRVLRGWRRVDFTAMTRKGPAVESLWFNYPEPEILHDYRYLGFNFRERERIARKKRRWVGRLARMPVLERRALLAAISEFQV